MRTQYACLIICHQEYYPSMICIFENCNDNPDGVALNVCLNKYINMENQK